MKLNSTRLTVACLAIAALAAPAGFAQQQQQQPANSDPYQGVSHPPLDDQIVATPDTPAPKPKPSPVVPMPPPPPPATYEAATPETASASAAAPRYSAPSDAPVVTTGPSAADTHRWDNTDYGIVTTPVPPGEDNPQTPPYGVDTTVLHVRDSRATSSAPSNQLPAGAQIRIRLAEALSTDETQVGAPFNGKVMVNVIQNGSVIIPAGSTMRGRVVQVSQGHHFGPAASIRLRPDLVVLPDGTAYHLHAQVAYSSADGTQVGSEGALEPSSHVVKKSIEYGATMGTGAIVGAAVAGPPGALAGTLIGAGLVTTHLLLQHPDDASIPAGSDVIFSLTEPLYLTPTRN
jgi:hypothetical protein